jgi:rubrerythrin
MPTMELDEVWRRAIQRERDAQNIYAEMGRLVEDSSLKNLFAFLVEQEKKHEQMLEEEYEKYFTPEF